jgi:glyoxylase-like metal-dependent hydrolase (beta-lactamase superfamily II)
MTLDGTNTWVLREPGASASVVVDPGPLDEEHLRTVLGLAAPVAVVLLTHGHADHSAGARRLAELARCAVRALDPTHRLGSEGLEAGDRVAVGGLEVEVVATPGHTRDSLSFLLPAERAVLTGDTVLGRGTTVVAHPDGELGAYLGSLHRLRARLSQVREAVSAGARTPAEVVARVYADVDPVLWPAAELSVAAQLAYLAERRRPD